MLRRTSILIAVLLVVALPLFSEGQKQQPASEEIRVGISTEPWDLDPATATDTGSYHILKNVYDPIIEYDSNNQLTTENSLTRDYEWKDQNKTLILHLREGVTFHDGSEFSASDVKYNIEWQLDPDNDAPWKGQLGPIDTVTVIDKYTLEVKFKSPTPQALAMWAGTALFGIVPEGSHGERTEQKGTAGKLGTDLSRNPVGTGPYKFVQWRSGSQITLEKNENYWKDGVAAPKKAVFEFIGEPSAKLAALISGSIDIIDKVPFRDYATVKDMPGIRTKRMPGTALQILYLNLSNPPLGISADQVGNQDAIERALHVRRFLYYAINRQDIADNLFYGMATVAKGPWYPDSEWTSPKLKAMDPHNPRLAREHLAAAGYADGGLNLEFQATNAQWFVDVATIIQEQLREYNVNVEVVPVDKATLFDTMYESNDWDVLVEDWVFSDFSVLSYLGFNYPWNNWSPNHWHHADPDLRDLYHQSVPGHQEWADKYQQAVLTSDPEKRKQLVWELEETVVDKVVGVDMMIVDSLYAWRDGVKGYENGLDSIGIIDLRFVEDITN